MKILVTGATGMFGSQISKRLAEEGAEVLALTRSPEHAEQLTSGNIIGIVGDLDDPSTLQEPLAAADRLFLVSPMHPDLGHREVGAITLAAQHGLDQIVKLYGSVRHEGDALDCAHQLAIDSLRTSDVNWTLVSPQTVIESNVLAQADSIRLERSMYGAAGDGKIGMVALDDCVEAVTRVLLSETAEFAGENLEITGPQALTYAEIASEMSEVLGCTIRYVDMTETAFKDMLLEFGMKADDIELNILCHFRQMRIGKAALVTDTFELMTGKKPTSIREWTQTHRVKLELS